MVYEYKYIILVLFAVILLSAGCKESPNLQPELTGVWTRTIGSGEDTIEGILKFDPDATFDFTFKGDSKNHEDTEGRYSLEGNQITFIDNSCVDAGTYTFMVRNNVLTFKEVKDDCGPRKADLNGGWKRVEK
ncbi:MAG: hypothetical protein RIG61_07330 [Deltaproteobacteria bacterium]